MCVWVWGGGCTANNQAKNTAGRITLVIIKMNVQLSTHLFFLNHCVQIHSTLYEFG